MYTLIGERGAHHRSVSPVVMIAQDREDPMRCPKTAQRAGAGNYVIARMRYVISSQNHQVGAKVIRHAHGFVDSLFVQKRAVMNVGKLNYAQTLKFSGKFIYSDYLMSDLDLMRFDHGRSQDRGESLAPLPAATAMFAFER
jgi:hypothetical protein